MLTDSILTELVACPKLKIAVDFARASSVIPNNCHNKECSSVSWLEQKKHQLLQVNGRFCAKNIMRTSLTSQSESVHNSEIICYHLLIELTQKIFNKRSH